MSGLPSIGTVKLGKRIICKGREGVNRGITVTFAGWEWAGR